MFSAFGNIVGRPLGWFLGQSPVDSPDGSQPTPSSSSSPGEATPARMASSTLDAYRPSVIDVLVVKAMVNRAFGLPIELIDTIVDMAEYWPHSTVIEASPRVATGGRQENLLLVCCCYACLLLHSLMSP